MIREGEQTGAARPTTAGKVADGNGRGVASAIAEGSHIGDYVVGRAARPDRLFLKYFGTHATQQTAVFLKIVRPGIAVERSGFDDSVRRFSALNHPSVLPVIDGGHHDSLHFIVEPVVDGFSFFEGLRADHFLDEDKPKIIQEMADGLSALHAEGVVHGDLSTDTVFVSADDIALVAGYGFSKIFKESGHAPQRLDMALRRFCAPEVLAGQDPDVRSDVYSFAAVSACLLLGKENWERSDAQLTGIVMSPAVKACLLRGMAKKAEERPGSVAKLATELLAALAGQEPAFSAAAGASGGATASGPREASGSGKKKIAIIAGAGVAVAAAAVAAIVLKPWQSGSSPAPTSPATSGGPGPNVIVAVPSGEPAPEVMATPVPPTPTPAGLGATNAWLQRVQDWPDHFRVAVLVPGMVPWKNPAIVVFDDGTPGTRQAIEGLYAAAEKEGLLGGVVRIIERPTDTVALAARFEVTARPQVLFVETSGQVNARFTLPADPADFVAKLKAFAPAPSSN